MSNETRIKTACNEFINKLGDLVTDESVFPTLAYIAECNNLRLSAQQRGINGTFISFTKDN